MYTDAQNRPSDNQAVSGNGTTVKSTDSIDLLTANRNVGRGGPMRAIAQVTADMVGGTSLIASLIESANSDLSSSTVIASGPSVALADAVAGAILIDVPMPDTNARYIGFQYALTGNFTAGGTISAHIVAGTDRPSTEVFMEQGL